MTKSTTPYVVIESGYLVRLGRRLFVASCSVCWRRSPLCMGTLRGAVRMLRRLGWMDDKRGKVRCPDCIAGGVAIAN